MKRPLKQRLVAAAAVATTFGLALTPAMAGAVNTSANTTVNATVSPVISMSTASPVSLTIAPTAGGVLSNGSDTVTVSTNDTAGYNLTLADSDATTTLVSGANTFTSPGTAITAAAALTNGTWGFAVAHGTAGINGSNTFDATYSTETNNASSISHWAGVPATGAAVTLKSTAATATNDTTTVWYAAKANTSQAAGTYSDTVTYTATGN